MGKNFLLVLLLLALVPLTAGAREEVRIPVVVPLSGPWSALGEGVVNGARLKAEELNSNGGINGRPVAICLEDDGGMPDSAALVAARLAADRKVLVVVGQLRGSALQAALPVYSKADLPIITPAVTEPFAGCFKPICFRLVSRNDCQGDFLCRYVVQNLHLRRVAIFFVADGYGLSLKDAFVDRARRLGLQVLVCTSGRPNRIDYRAQLASIKSLAPDAVFIAGYATPAGRIIAQARSLGMKSVFFGADALDDGLMLENRAAEGLFVTAPFLLSRGGAMVRDFVERYRSRFGSESDWLAANTYDAVGLAAAALSRGGDSREKVRGWLAGIDAPEKAYRGITGPIYFSNHGVCRRPVLVKSIRHGRWTEAAGQARP